MNGRNALALQTLNRHSELAAAVGFREVVCHGVSEHLPLHYSKMLGEVRAKEQCIAERDGRKFFDRAVRGLKYWQRMYTEGHRAWGIWHFAK